MAMESPEQVRQRHIHDMGRDLGPVYHLLWNEVAWLHAKWNQYRQLYGCSPEQVVFLNEVAGHFFGVIQHTLMDDILLHLMRLTDQSKRNLSLRRLSKLAPDPTLGKELEGLVRAACKACDRVAKTSRNQRIAHTDFACAVTGTFDPLPSRAEVEAALQAIRAVLIRLEVHCWPWEKGSLFQDVIPEGGDASSLVRYLQEGVRAEKRWIERIVQGKPWPEAPAELQVDHQDR